MTARMRLFLRLVFWANLAIACLCLWHAMLSGLPDLAWMLLPELWVGYTVDKWLRPLS
ncbi:MAG TPA: hypothetical protein VFN67_36405 [Polyangiales bacterium]|nr:hypothetical protein [Polyangiales bacterium]